MGTVQERYVATVHDERTLKLYNPFDEDDVLRQNRAREKLFAFDRVFDDGVTQQGVFEQTAALLIEDVVNGTNATVFAYGATGSGKTYTMHGTEACPGIVPQTLSALFQRLAASPERLTVAMSYIEIYNENVRDLLSATRTEYLEVRDDPIKGTVIAGMRQIESDSVDVLLGQLKAGNRHRITESTAANSVSSRSHAVVQLALTKTHAESKKRTLISKLSLIDLAGSERAAATQNAGLRMLEGSMINRSLLALGNCINALSSRVAPAYVNYRDSKLTRILKDSLGGGLTACRTVMIANISPGSTSFDETWNTIKYAARAKTIKVKIDVRVTSDPDGAAAEVRTLGSRGSGSHRSNRSASGSLSKVAVPAAASTAKRKGLSQLLGGRASKEPAPAPKELRPPKTPKPGPHQHPPLMPLRRTESDPTSKIPHPHGMRPPATPGHAASTGAMATSRHSSGGTVRGGSTLLGLSSNGAVGGATRQMALKKKLHKLFQSHLDTKRRLLDLDELAAERAALLTQRHAELAAARAAPDGNDPTALAALEAEIHELESRDAEAALTRTSLAAQLAGISARVIAVEDEVQGKLSLVDTEFLRALVAHHALALDNMDLESTAVVTAAVVKRKEDQVRLLEARVARYHRLAEMLYAAVPIDAMPAEASAMYLQLREEAVRSDAGARLGSAVRVLPAIEPALPLLARASPRARRAAQSPTTAPVLDAGPLPPIPPE
ncbi:Kinesin-like protein kif19 [Blastocladiella emersonii ATCC 22665]|nr:Kinesin-like protein kif19 [Blastocladiella emersonii ATCC 22665]